MQLRNTFRTYGRSFRYHLRLICIGAVMAICVTFFVSLCISPVYQTLIALFVSLWATFLLMMVYYQMSGRAKWEGAGGRSHEEQETAPLARVALPETPRPHILTRELSAGLGRVVVPETPPEVAQVQPPAKISQPLFITLPSLEKDTNIPGGEALRPSSFKKGLDLPGQSQQRSRTSGLRQYVNSDWQLE